MARAKRKGWITANPCEDAEKVTVQRSDDFNVLSVEQVHPVEREATSELLRALFLTAAFTGLRMGELLALRWRHIDFASRILHVQRNYVEGEEDTPKSHRRRSVPISDQAMVALEALSQRRALHGAGRPGVLRCGRRTLRRQPCQRRVLRRARARGTWSPALSAPSEDNPKASCETIRSSSTTCAIRSVRSARPRASTCGRSRRGWATPTSRRRCGTCTTCRPTTMLRGSRPRSPSRRAPKRAPNWRLGHPELSATGVGGMALQSQASAVLLDLIIRQILVRVQAGPCSTRCSGGPRHTRPRSPPALEAPVQRARRSLPRLDRPDGSRRTQGLVATHPATPRNLPRASADEWVAGCAIRVKPRRPEQRSHVPHTASNDIAEERG